MEREKPYYCGKSVLHRGTKQKEEGIYSEKTPRNQITPSTIVVRQLKKEREKVY